MSADEKPKGTSLRWFVIGVATLALLGITAMFVFSPRPAPLAPLPNPNGYDDFLQAGLAVSGDVGNYSTLDKEALSALMEKNAEALRLIRLGLSRQCMLPFDAAATNASGMINDLANLKRLAFLFAAEGHAHELDGRNADAAKSYMDAIRFGNELGRGGFLITRLVGIACESIGRSKLAGIAKSLNCDEALPVAHDLEKLDANRVTWDEVLANERRYARAQPGYGNPLVRIVGWWQSRRSLQKAAMRHRATMAHERLLAVEIALGCYTSRVGHAPATLTELVPQYLSKVPEDPFTGKSMIYQPKGTNWLVYSVGPDKVDNGGAPLARGSTSPGDILFDSSW